MHYIIAPNYSLTNILITGSQKVHAGSITTVICVILTSGFIISIVRGEKRNGSLVALEITIGVDHFVSGLAFNAIVVISHPHASDPITVLVS